MRKLKKVLETVGIALVVVGAYGLAVLWLDEPQLTAKQAVVHVVVGAAILVGLEVWP